MFNKPILFLIFNRPETTSLVFEQIRKIKPKYLYVAADGPRNNIPWENEICAEVKNIVLSNIDWECGVKTLFREENLGCGQAISQAITWFFENVEEGIILEDDCLPDKSFFIYCEQLLEKYKHNDNIISIGGTNLGYRFTNDHSYSYSRFMNMWGWATWRRASQLIDYNMDNWKKIKFKSSFLYTKLHTKGSLDIKWVNFWKNCFDLTSTGKIDTWDYQWIFSQLYTKKISIFPSKNLIKNIGFSDNATHTIDPDHPIASLELQTLQFPLMHPYSVIIDLYYEEEYVKKIWFSHKKESLVRIVKTKLLYIPIVSLVNRYFKNISLK
jgi:hypothetical protein